VIGYGMQKRCILWEDGGQTGQSISDSFQARLHGLYSQGTGSKETDFMKLAKEWNKSGSQDEGRDLIIQNGTIYVLGEGEEVTTRCVSRNETGAEFQARLKGVDKQDRPRMEFNNTLPAKACKRSEPSSGITSAIIKGRQIHKDERVIALGDGFAPTLTEISTLQDIQKLTRKTYYN